MTNELQKYFKEILDAESILKVSQEFQVILFKKRSLYYLYDLENNKILRAFDRVKNLGFPSKDSRYLLGLRSSKLFSSLKWEIYNVAKKETSGIAEKIEPVGGVLRLNSSYLLFKEASNYIIYSAVLRKEVIKLEEKPLDLGCFTSSAYPYYVFPSGKAVSFSGTSLQLILREKSIYIELDGKEKKISEAAIAYFFRFKRFK